MKKTFAVYLIQSSTQVVFIDAESEDEARRIADDGLETGKYDGGWEDCDPEVQKIEEEE